MVLVYLSFMFAEVGSQILVERNMVTAALIVITALTFLALFNWKFLVRFWYTFPRDMRQVDWYFEWA